MGERRGTPRHYKFGLKASRRPGKESTIFPELLLWENQEKIKKIMIRDVSQDTMFYYLSLNSVTIICI